ncbi:MAG: Mov34/MPN/PAD-1 family protein [Polyangiaceae bacterium]|nr:Mov34/MPN/PAD-1 family protein [Polyangiaceae bacterium]
MSAIVFIRAEGARLKLDEAVVEVLLSYAQRDPNAMEAGGVLMGRHIRGTRDVVVDSVTTPMRGDRRSRFSFHRSRRPHQRALDEAWKLSEGTCVYLGEWHTHPEPYPNPSSVDLADWRKRLRHDEVDSESLFFIIVGQELCAAWEGLRSTREISPLEQISHRPRRVSVVFAK